MSDICNCIHDDLSYHLFPRPSSTYEQENYLLKRLIKLSDYFIHINKLQMV